MDGVVHFDIPADDAERAKAFYSTVFDWEMQDFPDMQYTIMMTTPIDDQSQRPTTPGAINGGLMSRSKETPTPVITIGVDSVEEALKKVEAEGGTVITPSTRPRDGCVRLLQGLRRQRDGLVPVHLNPTRLGATWSASLYPVEGFLTPSCSEAANGPWRWGSARGARPRSGRCPTSRRSSAHLPARTCSRRMTTRGRSLASRVRTPCPSCRPEVAGHVVEVRVRRDLPRARGWLCR